MNLEGSYASLAMSNEKDEYASLAMSNEKDEWSAKSYSTSDGIEYTIGRIEVQQERRSKPEDCSLVVVGIGGDGGAGAVAGEVIDSITIPCFYCDNNHFSDTNDYFEKHTRFLKLLLSDLFTDMPPSSVNDVSESVKSVIRLATALHSRDCLQQEPITTTVHQVFLEIRHPIESNEVAPRSANAASVDSLVELFRFKCRVEEEEGDDDRFEIGWSNDHVCVICIDEIQTRESSLAIPCSHVFHEDCLVQWLETSHVCPLCRYELPTHGED